MFSHDFGGTRFSPLADINADNAAKLAQAWSVQLTQPAGRRGGGAPPAEGAPPQGRGGGGRGRAGGAAAAGEEGEAAGSNPEVTPIVINGVMYLPARGNQVLALDGDTGKEIWRYQMPPTIMTTARGVAYWPGEANIPPRIILSAGPRLLALDAATGQPAAGFGRNGMIEIQVPWNGVPMIYKHVAVLGTYPGEVPLGPTGDTRAFDLRTGKKLWQFQNVPLPGQVGHETWLDYGWRDRSGTNVWAFYMTLDAERGILYMPVSAPAANYWGGDRPGANLFANSIVAVDAETGKYRWHFQTVHHDIWDFDMPAPPVLVDITQNGRRVPALASIGKSGYMFILNRVTGKPIFGVEERPVAKGDVPDEWYSPTQPFPVKPARSFGRVAFDKDRDMVRPEDTSAQHAAECQALWDKSGGFHNAGPFTPFVFHEDGAPPRSSVQFPGASGGVNWGGPAADPRSGLVFINAHDSSLVGWLERKKPGLNYGRNTEGSTQPYDRGSVNGPGPYFNFTAPFKDETGRTVVNAPLLASAMGSSRGGQCEHGRRRVGSSARPERSAARIEASYRQQRQRRPERDGRRPRLRRRDLRSPAPRLRCEDREGAVVVQVRRSGEREPDDLPRQRRQAIRRRRGDRHARRLLAALAFLLHLDEPRSAQSVFR